MGEGVVKNSKKSADIIYERPLSVIDHGIFRIVLAKRRWELFAEKSVINK